MKSNKELGDHVHVSHDNSLGGWLLYLSSYVSSYTIFDFGANTNGVGHVWRLRTRIVFQRLAYAEGVSGTFLGPYYRSQYIKTHGPQSSFPLDHIQWCWLQAPFPNLHALVLPWKFESNHEPSHTE